VLQALATAARTLAQPQRLPRATSQALKPTGSRVLHTARTPTPTPLATKAMAAATLVATLVVEWPAMFQALRPTESLVLLMARTPTVTLDLAATRAMAATLAQVYPSVAALFACMPSCMQVNHLVSMAWSYLSEYLGAMLLLDHSIAFLACYTHGISCHGSLCLLFSALCLTTGACHAFKINLC